MHERRCLPLLLAALVLWPALACHDLHFEPRGGQGDIEVLDDLYTVAVVDPNVALGAGYWGAIYRTEDGGKSWSKTESGTKRLIYGISMADAQQGWAVGQLGTVLRTSDGGKTWERQSTPKDQQGVHFFAVQAVSPQQAIIVGEWGTRLLTEDGGKSWQDNSLTIAEDHPQFVWLTVPDQEKVRRGELVFEDVTLNDVSCLTANRHFCWIIGEFAYLYRSEEGGRSWERGKIESGIEIQPISMGHNEITLNEASKQSITAFAKAIADQQHLNIAIEPRVSEREIKEFGPESDPFPLFEIVEARTQEVQSVIEDAGILSDRIRRRGAPPWDWEEFIEDDPEFLKRYMSQRRADQPGVEVQISQNPYLFAVRFADQNEGWIAGLGGVVLRSHDSGRTWTYEKLGRVQAIFGIHPFSGDTAIVVGEKGLIYATEDGGKSWKQWPGFPTIFTFMRTIAFAPGDRVGYIVGQRAMVLRSEDSGKTWTQVLPKSDAIDLAEVEGELAAEDDH
ncbi:MAG: WD40/YVTN/BNR-like repeat-containing protein [Myxococcota bacterium]